MPGFFILQIMTLEEIYTIYQQYPSVNTDTRKIKEGDLFFALKGDNFNGNRYANRAISLGAAYVIVDEVFDSPSDKTIVVDDVLKTLQDLASYHRKQLGFKIIAATGSNGKTTSKELIQKVLEKKYNCFATPGNFNNHIGLPLSILQIKKECEIAILEMGDNKPGDVTELCNIAFPDYGFITNIGKDHIEGFGSMEGNIKAKKEIYDYLASSNGNIFLNTNDELVKSIASDFEEPISYSSQNDFAYIAFKDTTPFVNYFNENETEVNTQLIGAYNFDNIQLAHCIGKYFEVDSNSIDEAIKSYSPDNNRSQIVKTGSNTLILDAYNANPSSVEKALESFEMLKDNKEKWIILGDMLELGGISKEEHLNIINYIKSLNFKNVILIGKEYTSVNSLKEFKSFAKKQDAESYLKDSPITQANVLLKGSRGMKLETLQELL